MQRGPFKGGSPCNDCEAGRYMVQVEGVDGDGPHEDSPCRQSL